MSSADSEKLKLKEDLAQFFKNTFQKENLKFEIDEIKMSPCCPSGENFVAEVIQLTITGRYLHNAEKLGVKSAVIKRIPSTKSIQHSLYDIFKMFQNEITFYENILPIFQSHGVKIFPQYYGRSDDFIALEDLTVKGFKMADRIQGFNLQECKTVLRELAGFHATSFALKKATDKKFQYELNNLQEVIYNPEYVDSAMAIIWENSLKFAIKSLETSNDINLHQAAQNIKKYSGKVFSHLMMITKPLDKFGVICHGDLWSNNIMVKYSENDTLIEVKLLDLQAARHSSCALDVMHLLFTSASPAIVKEYMNDLLKVYFEVLTSKMETLGTPAYFAFDDFRDEFRKKISYGLLVSFLMFTFIAKKDNTNNDFSFDIGKLSNEKKITEMYKALDPDYHIRLHSLISGLLESKFLT